MQIVNDGLSEPLYQAILRWQAKYERSGYLSTTSCLKPPRMRVLETRYDAKVVVIASTLLDAFVGSAVHAAIEGAEQDAIHEEEFITEIGGIKFSGRPDVIRSDVSLELGDFKTTKVSAYIFGGAKLKTEYSWQANINSWLARLHGYDVKQAWVEHIFLDWNRMEAKRDRTYPPHALRLYPTLLPDAEVRSFVEERVRLHLDADGRSDNDLPHCTIEEQWARADAWAVMKDGGARATKVCDSELEAKRLLREKGSQYSIEFRPGFKTRCETYCNAKPFCNQYMDELTAKRERTK